MMRKRSKAILLMMPLILCITGFVISGNVYANLLRIGAAGEEVREIQSALEELGFLSGPVDGIYGQGTRDAVESFQVAAGISPDGIIGDRTRDAIRRARGLAKERPVLSRFMHEPEVILVQNRLKELGYYPGPVDGIFGGSTERAVKQFQREAELDRTGIVGEKTWRNLLEEVEVRPAPERPLLRQGDEGAAVERLQTLLNELGFTPGEPDGVFGYQTRLKVKQAQEFLGIEVDGVVGPVTWEALEDGANGPGFYSVQRGDTLWQLARKWGTSVEQILQVNNMRNPETIQSGERLKIPGETTARRVMALPWSQVNGLFPQEETAMITDLETGKSLRIMRLYGTNHADVEPLTARDTQVLLEIYGGEWSWERRSVIVHLNGNQIAGSINGYPHGGQDISKNNFDGHICLHFRGSSLHTNNQRDDEHQNQVEEAARATWPLGLR